MKNPPESVNAVMITLEPTFKGLFKKMDYHEYGGAPLLGVNGLCVISHGSSVAKTIASAIRNAKGFYDCQLNEMIVRRIAEVNAAMGGLTAAV